MRTIRVTGKGKLKVHPDMTRVVFSLVGLDEDYSEALRWSAGRTEECREILNGLGFERSELKTLSFDVEAQYDYVDIQKSYEKRFAGYRYRHRLKVEFEPDNQRLGRILYELANNMVSAEVEICYFVKDQEAAKNEILSRAVADARQKAALLSQAAGVTLKEIQTIDYSWGEVRFRTETIQCSPAPCSREESTGSYDLDIEPDDICEEDSVTVVWEIA